MCGKFKETEDWMRFKNTNDWEHFREYLEEQKEEKGIRPLFFVESGAGLYGFLDKESDVDIRGVVIEDIERLLGLGSSVSTLDSSFGDIDYEIHELKKYMDLLYDGNFNMIEWTHSPLVQDEITTLTGNEMEELRDIAKECISPSTGKHVRGWSYSMYKMDWSIPKKCLYAIRPMMVYINFCLNGQVESDIQILIRIDEFQYLKDHVQELIRLKEQSKEVPEKMQDKNKEFYDRLEERTKEVEGHIKFPDQETKERINKFIVEWRKDSEGN